MLQRSGSRSTRRRAILLTLRFRPTAGVSCSRRPQRVRHGFGCVPSRRKNAQALAGTEGAIYPFWSPDSRSVGFFAEQKLKRIDITGGTARTLADAPYGMNGATWSRDGLILFVPANGAPLYRLPGDGGTPVAVTRLETPGQLAHRFPHFLLDGRHFVYWVSGMPEVNGVHVGNLESGRTSRLIEADMLAGVAPPDYVLFVRQETLLAQRLNLRTLKLTGDPIVVSDRVERDTNLEFRAAVSASTAGPLAYRTPATVRRQLIWFDRLGRRTANLGEFDTSSVSGALRVSPDGRLVAFVRRVNGQTDVWLIETARGVLRRFTSDRAPDSVPVWSPDGTRVAFDSNRRGLYSPFNPAPPTKSHRMGSASSSTPHSATKGRHPSRSSSTGTAHDEPGSRLSVSAGALTGAGRHR